MFSQISDKNNPKEILRIEVRLSRKVKLNAVLKKLDYQKNPNFRQIFNKDLCKKILQYYWHELIENKNMFLFDMESGPKKILRDIIKTYPKTKPKKAVYLVGLNLLSKDNRGIRELRELLEKRSSTRTWYRIAKDLDVINKVSGRTYHNWVQQVIYALASFEPIKLPT